MKRSTRKLNNKNKNKAKQMGGATREEWDTFTKDSLEEINQRHESKDEKTKAELLDFAKKYYELAWDTYEVQADLKEKIKEMTDNPNPAIKDILPEEQVIMDNEITTQLDIMVARV